jgi:hypothetical protein
MGKPLSGRTRPAMGRSPQATVVRNPHWLEPAGQLAQTRICGNMLENIMSTAAGGCMVRCCAGAQCGRLTPIGNGPMAASGTHIRYALRLEWAHSRWRHVLLNGRFLDRPVGCPMTDLGRKRRLSVACRLHACPRSASWTVISVLIGRSRAPAEDDSHGPTRSPQTRPHQR